MSRREVLEKRCKEFILGMKGGGMAPRDRGKSNGIIEKRCEDDKLHLVSLLRRRHHGIKKRTPSSIGSSAKERSVCLLRGDPMPCAAEIRKLKFSGALGQKAHIQQPLTIYFMWKP